MRKRCCICQGTNCSHAQYNFAVLHFRGIAISIRAVAGQRSSPDLCFATKSIKSMTKDIDLNVTQVGRDGTA